MLVQKALKIRIALEKKILCAFNMEKIDKIKMHHVTPA